ncbi:MAG: 30S ribosome-binding factor RbfA [Elainellaceae cyanobacterium]
MATSRRVARVAESIKREVSQMLFSDIKDDRVGMGMVSVTNVNVSGDLQHAKVFVSIYGSDDAKDQTMEGLQAATSFVRRELGRRMRLRRTPEILFVEDRGIEEGSRIISLINQLSRDSQSLASEGDSKPDLGVEDGGEDEANRNGDALESDSFPGAED